MDFPNLDPMFDNHIGLDYETSGLKYWLPDFRVTDISVAVNGHAWAFNIQRHPGVVDWLKDVLTTPGRKVAAHHAQFEYQCTRTLGIDPRAVDFHCTMVTACLINEHELTYDLESVCAQNGVFTNKSRNLRALMDALGVDTPAAALARISDAPPDLVATYVAGDALDALEVMRSQWNQLSKQDLTGVYALEHRLLPVLADMSWGGVRVNLEAAHAAIPVLTEKIDRIQAEINVMVGRPFNVNSTPQIRDFFKPEPVNKFQWRLIDGTLVGPTKSGKSPSLDQKAMREIQHPLATKILDLRKAIKLRDTFLLGHVIGSADGNGFVHTSFNQTRTDNDNGTITGRLSSTDPALQQITKRDKENAAVLRAAFVADYKQSWLCADYSQVDFRCGAHLQNDPSVIAMYRANPGLDYHGIVSEMTGIPRNPPYAGAPNTKQINLGLSFGAGEGKLAFMMNMPYEITERRGRMAYIAGPEAKRVFQLYHTKLPAVKKFMEKAESVARETGYVRTAIGRRLRFPRGFGAHKAAGLLYQAYAADLHKFGLVMADECIRANRIDARLNMSCHDELGASMVEDEEAKALIVNAYTNFHSEDSPIRMNVPIRASANFGANWWEASKD